MADIGTGATLAYTGWPSYSILSISPSGASRAAVPSSHLGTTGGQTFIAGDTYDPGEIEVECIMDNEDPNTNDPPITDAAATLTITFPTISGDTAGATMAATAFCTGFSGPNFGFEELVTITMTFKLSGNVTWANAS
jgi:hypothetical protein